jgi:hypothetical protein
LTLGESYMRHIGIDNVTQQLEDEGAEKFTAQLNKLRETLVQESPNQDKGS